MTARRLNIRSKPTNKIVTAIINSPTEKGNILINLPYVFNHKGKIFST
jgi:hypothetical protein